MNLSAYDTIDTTFSKDSNYISPFYKRLYSTTIKYRPFYCLLKRLENNYIKYFIALYDKQQQGIYNRVTKYDKKGIVKIDLDSIWEKSNLKNIKETINVSVNIDKEEEDCVIYELDI